MNSKEILWALCCKPGSRFNYRRYFCAVPNISWGLLPWEADLLLISKGGHLTEIEIKVSLSDWRCDAEKKKWRRSDERKWLRRFYYAVPLRLAERHADIVTAPGSGILAVDEKNQITVIREATPEKNAQRLSEAEMLKVARLGTMRFWSEVTRSINANKQAKALEAKSE